MASGEKRMIPLEIEDTRERQEERIDEKHSLRGLVKVKFPSRPRRRVVIIIAVIIVVFIVAAVLIGTFVSSYDNDRDNGKNISKYSLNLLHDKFKSECPNSTPITERLHVCEFHLVYQCIRLAAEFRNIL